MLSLYGRRSSKPKKRKPKKENWFEKLTVEQLKQLCAAVRVPVSGNKPAQIERLLANEGSKQYAHEPARISWKAYANYSYDSCDEGGPGSDKPSGPCAETIKQRARDAGLSVTGNKFDLVLRLLQHQSGVGSPKRAAGHFDENEQFQPKKRAKSMVLPDPDKLYERMARKCSIDFAKASDMTLKFHASGVMMLINKLAHAEIVEKTLVARGEVGLAWAVCESLVFPCLPEEGSSAQHSPCYGWGRVEDYDLKSFGDFLRSLAKQSKESSDAATLARIAPHASWISDFATMVGEDAASETLAGYHAALTLVRSWGAVSSPASRPAAQGRVLHSPPTVVKQPPLPACVTQQ